MLLLLAVVVMLPWLLWCCGRCWCGWWLWWRWCWLCCCLLSLLLRGTAVHIATVVAVGHSLYQQLVRASKTGSKRFERKTARITYGSSYTDIRTYGVGLVLVACVVLGVSFVSKIVSFTLSGPTLRNGKCARTKCLGTYSVWHYKCHP